MAGFNVTALALDQNGSPSRFTVAVSVTDSDGLGIQNLSENNFIVRNIASDTDLTVAELRSAGLPGFYRLSLRADPMTKAGRHVLALVVTSPHQVMGRVPEPIEEAHTLVQVSLA
ncbi:hypothetical protein [Dictyobacter formicarum]|uniref:Uncharacterized protein n=1 Tax=Dictyobacter formicarum TaxID=2778368 RepID=A0ABQ3VNX8_9CHLR|nr:hypothetical protein [Dictyobacter formicarum]GHO87101.1 hypothetical protein KSZ_51070 [Dictyobacter formicarum]